MASESEFQTGTVVRLKSGGPQMTVKEWNDRSKTYNCQWFAGKKLEQGFFQHDSLVLVQPEPENK